MTRAAMPTLVATMAAATKMASWVGSPRTRRRYAKPSTKGASTPAMLTPSEVRPTRISSLGLVSNPTVNSRKMAPNPAMESVVAPGLTNLVA